MINTYIYNTFILNTFHIYSKAFIRKQSKQNLKSFDKTTLLKYRITNIRYMCILYRQTPLRCLASILTTSQAHSITLTLRSTLSLWGNVLWFLHQFRKFVHISDRKGFDSRWRPGNVVNLYNCNSLKCDLWTVGQHFESPYSILSPTLAVGFEKPPLENVVLKK